MTLMKLRRVLVMVMVIATVAAAQAPVAPSAWAGTHSWEAPIAVGQQRRPPRIAQAHELGRLNQPASVAPAMSARRR
jgi:hypothetical protein